MMAIQVARELGLGSVVVPRHPGEFSTISSDLRVTKAVSPMDTLTALGAQTLEAEFSRLSAEARADLLNQGVTEGDVHTTREIFAMYAGQTWDNPHSVRSTTSMTTACRRSPRACTTSTASGFGFTAEELPIMVTTIEVTAAAARPAEAPRSTVDAEGESLIRHAPLRLAGRDFGVVPVHDRARLSTLDRVHGPAIIVEQYATTAIDEGSGGPYRRVRKPHRPPGRSDMTEQKQIISAVDAHEKYGFDLVDLETLRYGLIEVARDMHETLMRGGFSPIVRDVRDCTAAVHVRTDADRRWPRRGRNCVQHAFVSQHIANFVMDEWDSPPSNRAT